MNDVPQPQADQKFSLTVIKFYDRDKVFEKAKMVMVPWPLGLVNAIH